MHAYVSMLSLWFLASLYSTYTQPVFYIETLSQGTLLVYLCMQAKLAFTTTGSNIVVDENVNIKVLDFGLARPSRSRLDKTGYANALDTGTLS
jgi:hypothetical protein